MRVIQILQAKINNKYKFKNTKLKSTHLMATLQLELQVQPVEQNNAQHEIITDRCKHKPNHNKHYKFKQFI